MASRDSAQAHQTILYLSLYARVAKASAGAFIPQCQLKMRVQHGFPHVKPMQRTHKKRFIFV